MVTQTNIVAIGSVLPSFDIVVVALRFYAKRKRRAPYAIDDWLILVSLIIACGCGAVLITGGTSGAFGSSSPGNTPDSGFVEQDSLLVLSKKLVMCLNFMQLWSLATAKLSMIFFYRSIFRGATFSIMSWTMIGVVIAWLLGGFFAIVFQCGPHISLLWTSAANVAKYCSPGTSVALGFAIPDVIIDVLILFMPIHWTLKLHMSFAKKLAVCSIFCFGALTVLASIGRLAIYLTIYPNHNHTANQIGLYSDIVFWATLEIGLSIIAACLPTLWPLFAIISNSPLTSSLRSFLSNSHSYPHSATAKPSGSSGVASSSQTQFVPNMHPNDQHLGVESIAMGDVERAEGRDSVEVEGRILVTTDMIRHESLSLGKEEALGQ